MSVTADGPSPTTNGGVWRSGSSRNSSADLWNSTCVAQLPSIATRPFPDVSRDLDAIEVVLLVARELRLEPGIRETLLDASEKHLALEQLVELPTLVVHAAGTANGLDHRLDESLVVKATNHLLAERRELGELLERPRQLFALDALPGLLDRDDDVLRRLSHEVPRHFALVLDVPLGLPLLDLVERRLGDVDVAPIDQVGHLAEEERQEQRADVRAVDVRVGHDDHLVIPQLVDVEVLLADAAAEGGDERSDLRVGQHLVEARLLDVQDLALERQDRLESPVAPLLGRAAGRVALDQVQLGHRRVLLGAVGELSGQVPASRARPCGA